MAWEAPTPEQIKEILQKKQALKGAMVGTAPVYVEAPVVEKKKVVRIDSPPVGIIPTEQGSNQTLSTQTEIVGTVPEILKAAGINPVQELLDAYNERVEDPTDPDYGKFVMSKGERRGLMKELLKYTHPTLKSVEHVGGHDNRITVVLNMPDGSRHEKQIESRGKVLDAGN